MNNVFLLMAVSSIATSIAITGLIRWHFNRKKYKLISEMKHKYTWDIKNRIYSCLWFTEYDGIIIACYSVSDTHDQSGLVYDFSTYDETYTEGVARFKKYKEEAKKTILN